MKKFLLITMVVLLVMTTMVSCTVAETPTGKPITKDNIKIGAIFLGESSVAASESGAQAFQLDEARKAAGIADTQIIKKDNVTAQSFEGDVYSLVESGCRLIMVYSNSFDELVEKAAKDYPGIYFAVENGKASTLANVKTYSAKLYQAQYLSGICAGLNAETNKIGFIAVEGASETQNEINAFAKGVYAVNKDAVVFVEYIKTDTYEASFNAAKTLIEEKECGVIAQNCFSEGAVEKAKASEKFFCGYYRDMLDLGPLQNLTSAVMNTKTFIEGALNAIFNNTWTAFDKTSLTIVNAGVDVKLNPSKIDYKTTKLIEAVKVKLVDGSIQIFDNLNIKVTFGAEDEVPAVEVAEEVLTNNEGTGVALDKAVNSEWLYRNVEAK